MSRTRHCRHSFQGNSQNAHECRGRRGGFTLNAETFLLTEQNVVDALGPGIVLLPSDQDPAPPGMGGLIEAATIDSAFRRFTGTVAVPDGVRPMAVSVMALLFDAPFLATRTFSQVAKAAHLRAPLEGTVVAVETVTAPSGLVSYWGFLHRGRAITILTLDTLDADRLTVADLRSLAVVAAEKLRLGAESN